MTTGTLTLTEFLLARIAEDEARLDRIVPADESKGGIGLSLNDGLRRWQRECEAKRSIIEMHDAMPAENVYCMTCDENHDWPCATLKTVAAVYADHPDFREEWRA